MMISGYAAFGGVYAATAFVGTLIYDTGSDLDAPDPADDLVDREREMATEVRRRRLGASMMVPLVGPFIGMASTEFTTSRYILALSGAAQLGLLTMGILGTVRYARGMKRYRAATLDQQAHFRIVPTGNGVTMLGRF